MDIKCPDCSSTQCIPWDDGFICCDCGTEFGSSPDYEEE